MIALCKVIFVTSVVIVKISTLSLPFQVITMIFSLIFLHKNAQASEIGVEILK